MSQIRPHQVSAMDGLKSSFRTALALETWMPVAGYEGYYEVSDLGNVRSLDRIVSQINRWGTVSNRRLGGGMLSQTPDTQKYGYGRLTVKLCKDGMMKTKLVSQLVLIAFVGPRPEGHEGAHWDGDTSNNKLSNLRWATPKGNSEDRARHGTQVRGEMVWNSKLTKADVLEIKSLKGSLGIYPTAERFGISIAQVSRIQNGKRWAHITAETQS